MMVENLQLSENNVFQQIERTECFGLKSVYNCLVKKCQIAPILRDISTQLAKSFVSWFTRLFIVSI